MEFIENETLFPQIIPWYFLGACLQRETSPSPDSSRKYTLDDLKGFEILAGTFYHLIEREQDLSRTNYDLKSMGCILDSMNLILTHSSHYFPDLDITDSKSAIKHHFLKKR